MPKITNDPVRSYPLGLRRSHADFIERAGTGNNLSAKLRAILDRCQSVLENVEDRLDVVVIYEQNSGGEKIWIDNPPFEIKKKSGWRAVPKAAADAGWASQVIENKEEGTVRVLAAPGAKMKCCEECRKRVIDCLK